MRIAALQRLLFVCLTGSVTMFAGTACQRGTDTTTNANVNANSDVALANTNLAPVETSGIAAKEPERYRATVVFTAQTAGGERAMGIPTLSANVARDGADRRVEFKLPDGSDLIYLERSGEHFVIAPGRRQYAELDQESTGMQLQRLMTPGQLVSRLENLQGVERVGEETIDGRMAEKYRYTTATATGTQAGTVESEAFVFVDKETGLPLRSELFAEATGNVEGVRAARVVAEMRDISTDVDRQMFEIPEGFNRIPPEQVRQQIDTLAKAAAAVLQTVLGNLGTGQRAATPSPALSPTPTP